MLFACGFTCLAADVLTHETDALAFVRLWLTQAADLGRNSAQYQGSIHKACRIGIVEAIEAIAAKLRIWPTRRISSGQ